MTIAFTTGDLVNCPVTSYKIEKINEYKFDTDKVGTDPIVTDAIEIDSTTGIFTIKNCTDPM